MKWRKVRAKILSEILNKQCRNVFICFNICRNGELYQAYFKPYMIPADLDHMQKIMFNDPRIKNRTVKKFKNGEIGLFYTIELENMPKTRYEVSPFWQAVVYVMKKLRIFKPYATFIELFLNFLMEEVEE